MQNEPAKKKKKYILANNQPQIKDTSSKTTLVNNQLEEKALERSRFDYTFEQIVNHLLARLLPNSNFTIKLSEKLIFGEENELDDFVSKLD